MMQARDLYGLPLDRFVPERGALARELRKEGRREQAAEMAGLRKPSVAAWAVNQLIRTQSKALAELFEAGDALQHAHAQLLAGRGDGASLRNALARERNAVDELVEKARGLLSSEGHGLTPATVDRVSETLHAAALDADARAEVKDGCLHRELRHIGLGASGALGVTSESGSTGKTGGPARSTTTSAQTASTRKRERAEGLRSARKAESDARRVVQRAARELRVAEQRRDRVAESLRDAEAAVTAARKRAEEAARAHREAERTLERA
jgi:hypothetical protein